MESPFYCTEIEGEDVSNLLTEIKVEESDTQASLATLSLVDSELVLQEVLRQGLHIEIDLGRADAHSVVFRGMVTSVRAKIPSQGQPELEVEAMSSLVQLALRPITRQWQNLHIGDIVRKIAMASNLKPGQLPSEEGDSNPRISEMQPLQQIEETDLAFLLRLAQDYGSRLYVQHDERHDTLNFVTTQSLLEADPLSDPFAFNDNLEEFSVTVDSFAPKPAQLLISTVPTTGEPISAEPESSQSDTESECTPDPDRIARLPEGAIRIGRLATLTTSSRENAADFRLRPSRVVGAPAREAADKSGTFGDLTRRLGWSAEGRTEGNSRLQPRRRITVEGYGGCWSGEWYLAEVEHHLNVAQRQYTTSFTCTR